ncbi:uncharacterized protein PV09_08208 [Verruconis gallopava]|uniref:FAD-binding domain-containing protein n=1 Tax=Verruconis gallopava TaxID=253628 RepID=A0A0D1XDL0_9PEZI|nr:uncharacterized protein PV09_08208 [Verruconis gallopava]KIW00321.1 hypothetical protein PV09_08208 [Verruconis gallopava]
MAAESVPVLIVGGGVGGLSSSLFLAQHGIKSMIIERHSTTSIHPRARSVNARTMEIYRRLGIVDEIRKAGACISASAGMFHGPSLKEVIDARPRREGGQKFPFTWVMESVTPVNGTFVTQDMLEPVLVNEARRQGVDIRFYTEFVGFEQDEEVVTASVKKRDTEETFSINAQYLIAADGAKSPVRQQLKIPVSGRGSFGKLLNILFKADLEDLVRDREFSLCLIERSEVVGLFTSVNNTDVWVFHLHYDPAKGEGPEDFPPEKCKDLIRLALGIPGIEIDIKSILPWEPSIRVANHLKQGRVFLVGDSAHQMPPYAGQGANSAVASAHNLAWKLAAVLNGQAENALLETYEAERLPVGREAAEISAIGCDEKGMLPVKKNWEFFKSMASKLFIVAGFGYGYNSAAITSESILPLGGWTWRPWTLPSLMFSIDGRPGRRVPHVWIKRNGERISTIDLCGKNFVLFAGSEATGWLAAAKKLSSTSSVNIDTYCIGPRGDLTARSGVFETASGISSTGALLVRPDDFVVWRARRQNKDAESLLEQAIKKALCLA